MSEVQLGGGNSELIRHMTVQDMTNQSSPVTNSPQAKTDTMTEGLQAQVDAGKKQEAQDEEKRKLMDEAASSLNDLVKTFQRNLKFTVDDESGTSVISVHDAQTNELIRQIPSQDTLELIHNMDKVVGLLFKAEA